MLHPSNVLSPTGNSRTYRYALTVLVAIAIGGSLLWSADEPRPGPANPLAAPGPKPVATFSDFPDWVASVAFSPDGRWLAAGSYGTIKLFDVAERREAAALPEPAGFVKSLAFSADGGTLVSGSYQTVAVWDVRERKLTRRLKGHRGYVTGVAFSPDGRLVATASEDETVRLWDAATGEAVRSITGLGQPALGLAWSRDGQSLAVCTGDATRPTKKGTVRIYDAAGEPRLTIEGHDRIVSAVAFSADGSQLITASADEKIKVWNAQDGKEIRTLEGHSRPVNSLALAAAGRWLFSGSGGRNAGHNDAKAWDLATGKERATIPGHEGPVTQVAATVDGKWLATASFDRTVKLWDAAALVGDAPAEKPKEDPQVAQGKAAEGAAGETKTLRVGMIGLDTSHCPAFTKILNAKDAAADVSGCTVVAAYPRGSADIVSSASRIPMYTKEMQDMGVEIVDSIEAMLPKVDVILLETNDGRPHLEQVLPVLKAHKPVFIDKPIAASLADAVAIFEAGRKYGVPLFSSSSLRFTSSVQEARTKAGDVKACDFYGPCSLEATHPDLFWYGIHAAEALFTIMGTGCESVSRTSTPGFDVAVGTWNDGRIGTFRGIRTKQGGSREEYGGTVFGSRAVLPIGGEGGGYRPLLVEIVKFFRTGKPPVAEADTLQIYAFMEAADESKRQGGAPVKIEAVMAKAREEAARRLKELAP